jgi:hypothetical protein
MKTRDAYGEFIQSKSQMRGGYGFDPLWMPDWLFGFQRDLVEWSLRLGRGAPFADCGMGKGPMQLVWARNVAMHTGRPVLILTPLAVSHQLVREAQQKFDIDAGRSTDGSIVAPITVTNYQNLHKFDSSAFAGLVCDESSILKSFDGATRIAITEFCRTMKYRLLCTATAAPNDFVELGTSSEALGYLGHADMITRFFKEEVTKDYLGWGRKSYRFRGHAEQPFWRWVCSWARVCRRPSDMGYPDGEFVLPALVESEVLIHTAKAREGLLFSLPARDLQEQREERRLTLKERCDAAARIASEHAGASVVWCHLNAEGDRLAKLIPNSVQVSGSMPDDAKEEAFLGFQGGGIQRLITKPRIGGWGLNWQHCHNIVTFPSHSWESYYQSVRRCWRFGQKQRTLVSIITTEGELGVLRNLQRKAANADRMFESLLTHTHDALRISEDMVFPHNEEVPTWL